MEKVTKSMELDMTDLQETWIDCEMVACSNVCGPHENSLSIKKTGIRAFKLFDDEIGVEVELLGDRADEFNTTPMKPDATDKDIKKRRAELKEIEGLFKTMWAKKATIEYEEITVKTTREDGKDFGTGFPAEKTLTIKGKQYTKSPYACFLNLEAKGFITTTK